MILKIALRKLQLKIQQIFVGAFTLKSVRILQELMIFWYNKNETEMCKT